MPKMFGFSHRKMKLSRFKVHLGDPSQVTKSPMRPTKHGSQSNGSGKEDNLVSVSANSRSEDFNCECSLGNLDLDKHNIVDYEDWRVVSTNGNKPTPRVHHAAAVVGSKMVVVGGESAEGLLDDTMILNLDNLTWAAAAPKVYQSPTGLPVKIPACKGHCLVTWGKAVLLIGGKTDLPCERISVWSFDSETECWSHVEAKGDIPAARSGHIVIRAGPVLIIFGGEDSKGRKLNDLHMFDLKSLTWLPLHYKGTRPSPRSNHVAALHDDKILLVFGGQSKSRILNDIYSLDFETMIWARIKIRGHHPSARAGCGGAFCGNKWYIVGGGSKKKRHAETLVFDASKYEWSASITSSSATITTTKGFSLATVHHKSKMLLVAFGGSTKESSNQIEMLVVKNEHPVSQRSAPDAHSLAYEGYLTSTKELAAHLHGVPPRSVGSSVAKRSLASAMKHHVSGRKSSSDKSIDLDPLSGSVSLRKQFHNEEDYNLNLSKHNSLEDDKYKESYDCSILNNPSLAMEQRSKQQEATIQMDIAGVLARVEERTPMNSDCSSIHQKQRNDNISSDDYQVTPESDGRSVILTNPSNIYQLYETKISALTRKNALLEEQLATALSSRKSVEKNLSSVLKSNQDAERKVIDTGKEVELLKEKLAGVEFAQEEANSLSNMVHSDNVRLEHDVAFLKAVLDDTQKELHSTRGVLASERTRSFQLQVEVFHLKQRLQSFESRAPTPRKPYPM